MTEPNRPTSSRTRRPDLTPWSLSRVEKGEPTGEGELTAPPRLGPAPQAPNLGGPVIQNRQLHLITDRRYRRDHLLAAVRVAAENGVDWVQVRDHQATAAELLDLARAVVAICRPLKARVAVNDRIDVAVAAGADGVQLGRFSLSPEDARRVASTLRYGVSVHDRPSAGLAEAAGADWLTFGHVFPTGTHPGEPPRGPDALAEVVASARRPVIAVGGISRDNLGEVLARGAAGVAVISAILAAPDPAVATRDLRRLLDGEPEIP